MDYRRFALIAALALWGTHGVAFATPTFTTAAGPTVGADFGGCSLATGTTSVAVGPCADSEGMGDANASAQVGHVGVTVHAFSFGNNVTSGKAIADYTDTVTFTGLGTSPINVGLNLSNNGIINSTPGAQAGLGFSIIINGVFAGTFREIVGDGVVQVCDINVAGLSGCSTTLGGIITTGLVSVPVDTPVGFNIHMEGSAGSDVPGASASVEYSNSLDFVQGMGLFVLPEGYTANSESSYIFNNRFLPPSASVPEPASFALLGLGLLGVGFARRKQIR